MNIIYLNVTAVPLTLRSECIETNECGKFKRNGRTERASEPVHAMPDNNTLKGHAQHVVVYGMKV